MIEKPGSTRSRFGTDVSELQNKINKLKNNSKATDNESLKELAEIYKTLAQVHFRQSNYNEAEKQFTLALGAYTRIKNYHGIIFCQNAQASICLARGELAAAKNKLEKLLLLLKKHPVRELEHVVLNNFGIVHEKNGNLPRAVLYYHRSLALKYELNNPVLPSYTLHNLANVYFHVEDYSKSLKYNEMAHELIAETDDYNAQATIINGLAQTFVKTGELDKARKFYLNAGELASKANNLAQIAGTQAGLGKIEFMKGNSVSAKKLLMQSLQIFRELKEQENIASCLIELVRINQKLDPENAVKQIGEAIDICKLNGFRSILASAYELNASLKAIQGDYSKAYFFHKLFHDLFRETNKTNVLNQIELNKLSIELKSVKNQSEHLQKQAQKHKYESLHDHLTGAGNRRQLDEVLAKSWVLNTSEDKSNHIAMLDIDDFKKINDTYSHEFGDKVLQHVSAIIHNNIEDDDALFRYGGEEFIIFLRDKYKEHVEEVVTRICQFIENHHWQDLQDGLTVTATLGVANSDEESSIEKALQVADERMYHGKRNGKNQVIFY